jgi:uncharacterized membrane protein
MSTLARSLEEAGGAPNVRRGMLLMISGLALFSLLNGLVKFLAETFSVNQIIFFRNFFALATLLAMAPALGGLQALRASNKGGLALQAVQFTGVLGFIFLAYRHMPLADATAISFLQPLLVVLLSAPFLGERVTRVRWIGVILGFAGVTLMMRPTGTASVFGVSMALNRHRLQRIVAPTAAQPFARRDLDRDRLLDARRIGVADRADAALRLGHADADTMGMADRQWPRLGRLPVSDDARALPCASRRDRAAQLHQAGLGGARRLSLVRRRTDVGHARRVRHRHFRELHRVPRSEVTRLPRQARLVAQMIPNEPMTGFVGQKNP